MARHNGPATEAKASGRSSANWQNDKLGRRPNDRWTSGGRLLGRRHGQGLGFLPSVGIIRWPFAEIGEIRPVNHSHRAACAAAAHSSGGRCVEAELHGMLVVIVDEDHCAVFAVEK